jgi:DNA-binding transcriptional ArsR family regulator
MDSDETPIVRLQTPAQIRALVSPVRLAVVAALYDENRSLTATEAAQIAGVTPSAMSYHLRMLERAGIAKRAEPSGDGRERPWVRAGAELAVDPPEHLSRASAAATTSLIDVSLERDRAQLVSVINRRSTTDQTGTLDEATVYRRDQIRATLDEVKELAASIAALLAPYRAEHRPDPPADSGVVAVTLMIVPRGPDD